MNVGKIASLTPAANSFKGKIRLTSDAAIKNGEKPVYIDPRNLKELSTRRIYSDDGPEIIEAQKECEEASKNRPYSEAYYKSEELFRQGKVEEALRIRPGVPDNQYRSLMLEEQKKAQSASDMLSYLKSAKITHFTIDNDRFVTSLKPDELSRVLSEGNKYPWTRKLKNVMKKAGVNNQTAYFAKFDKKGKEHKITTN